LPEAPAYAAIDLGAESGRVVLGRLDGDRVALDLVHRFANRPVRLPDGLRWNLLALFTEALDGLRRAADAAGGALGGIGVDAWGVDYALLDGERRVLGLPFHYRDGRTDGSVARAHERVPAADLYAATGIQTMPINTVFQLLADEGSPALRDAEHIALVPDLFALWLTGELRNEATAASTTGLLDARTGGWAREIVARLGLPAAPFAGATTEPGTTIGPVLGHHAEAAGGAAGAPVHAVAGHDTASAFAAVPLRGERAAVLSSGTWSLLGLELPEPVLDERARAYNLTNERGVEGTTRLLRNVMGLWLVQECRRQWAAEGGPGDYDSRTRRARTSRCSTPTPTAFSPRATCPRGSSRRAARAGRTRRRRTARSCARRSSRSRASTASCSSASSA
jgi:rhamnulokinase